MGNLKAYDDAVTAAEYDYDALYRKIPETVDYGLFDLSYSYDYYKNGLKKNFTGPDGVTYSYTYDANNQLTGIQIPGTGMITYSAYRWNRPLSITLPGGSRKEMSYDPLMRITQITAKDPGGNAVLNYQYGYDRMDNIKTKATEHGLYAYTYDDLYRLVGADSPLLPAETYSYDPVGNRLTSAEHAEWTYNPNNELQSYNGVTFQYDPNGNTTQKNDNGIIQNFLYNEDDRLTEVKDGNGVVIATYYYDPFGRRLSKEVGGSKTYFIYADEGLIAEFDGTGLQTKSYGFAPNSTWTTNPLFMQQGTHYYFYHNDHLGTPQKKTSVSGAVVWSAMYESFAKAEIDSASTLVNNLRFPGQYYDQETGLHYNYHRYNDPNTGRYLASDPIGLEGGINSFIYAKDNSVNLIDPLGLLCRIEWTEGIGPVLYRWMDTQKIGYWEAWARTISWQVVRSRSRLKKTPFPPIETNLEKRVFSKYCVRYTLVERRYKAIQYWEICYDDCTGEKVSHTFLAKFALMDTQDVILAAWEVDKYLGDSKEYNRREVDPTIITP